MRNLWIKQIVLFFLLSLAFLGISAQEPRDTLDMRDTVSYGGGDLIAGTIVEGRVIEGDTVPHVWIRQVIVFPDYFRSRRQKRRYNRLVYHIKKVYPYSQIVKAKLEEINVELDSIEGKRARKKYLKAEEKALKKEFEGRLRKLTFTQGRILIKLINRETGETTYAIVKQLKGSLSAFFWQSVAVIFNSSLKYEYDAEGDDKMIEQIVVLLENGQL